MNKPTIDRGDALRASILVRGGGTDLEIPFARPRTPAGLRQILEDIEFHSEIAARAGRDVVVHAPIVADLHY